MGFVVSTVTRWVISVGVWSGKCNEQNSLEVCKWITCSHLVNLRLQNCHPSSSPLHCGKNTFHSPEKNALPSRSLTHSATRLWLEWWICDWSSVFVFFSLFSCCVTHRFIRTYGVDLGPKHDRGEDQKEEALEAEEDEEDNCRRWREGAAL